MSAHENLSAPLFHGTTENLKPGSVIHPTKQFLNLQTEAYATTSHPEAVSYAYSRSQNRGTLFGSVYEVEPLENDETLERRKSVSGDGRTKPVHVSKKGFRVKRHVGWV